VVVIGFEARSPVIFAGLCRAVVERPWLKLVELEFDDPTDVFHGPPTRRSAVSATTYCFLLRADVIAEVTHEELVAGAALGA
jgi:hypothetical protein